MENEIESECFYLRVCRRSFFDQSPAGWNMEDIKALIPHRDPFLFVDEIVTTDPAEIVGFKTFGDSFYVYSGLLPKRKIVPGILLVESMAQCGGAGAKKLGLVNRDFYVLATIKNARFIDEVEPGKMVTMKIKTLKILHKGIKQSGTAYCDGKVVAEGTWWCVKPSPIW